MAKTWEATNPNNTVKERNYIVSEARRLFKKNKDITDPEIIKAKIFEAEARYGLAMHYNIPYPRLYNVVHGAHGNRTAGIDLTCLPAYMHSYYDLDVKETPMKSPVILQDDDDDSW